MPNGDPNFEQKQLPRLRAFFAPLSRTIVRFARRHNLMIDRYYHQAPGWDLRFRHPKGGEASLEISKRGVRSITLNGVWWIDDYDEGSRSIKESRPVRLPALARGLTGSLRGLLQEVLSWNKGEWSEIVRGYRSLWQNTWTKREFLAFAQGLPKPRL